MRIKNKKKKGKKAKSKSSVDTEVNTAPVINKKIDAVPFTLGRRSCQVRSIRTKVAPKLFVAPEVTTALYEAACESDEDRVFIADVYKSEKKEDYSFIRIRETEGDILELIDTDTWICVIFLTDTPLDDDIVNAWKQLEPENCEYFFVGHANRNGILTFDVFCYKHNKIMVGVSDWEFHDDMYLTNEDEAALRSEIQEKMSVAVPIVQKSKPVTSSSYIDALWGDYDYEGIGFPNYGTVEEQINRLVDAEEEKDDVVDTEGIYGDLTVVGTITEVSSPTEGATASAGMLRVNVEKEGEYTLVIPCETIAEFEDEKYGVGDTIRFYRDPQAFKEKFAELDIVDIQHVDENVQVEENDPQSALLCGQIVLVERESIPNKHEWRLYIIVNIGVDNEVETRISLFFPERNLKAAQPFVEGAMIRFHTDDFLGEIRYANRYWNRMLLKDVRVLKRSDDVSSPQMTTATIELRLIEPHGGHNHSCYVYLTLSNGRVRYNICFAMPHGIRGAAKDIFYDGNTIEFPAGQWVEMVRIDGVTYHEFDWDVIKTARLIEDVSDEDSNGAIDELYMTVTGITIHDPIAQHAPYVLAIIGNSDDFSYIHRICVESWCMTDGLVDLPFSVGDRLTYNIKDVIGECEYEGQKWLKLEKAAVEIVVDLTKSEGHSIVALVSWVKTWPSQKTKLGTHLATLLVLCEEDGEQVTHYLCVEIVPDNSGTLLCPFFSGDEIVFDLNEAKSVVQIDGQDWVLMPGDKVELLGHVDVEATPEVVEAIVQEAKIINDEEGLKFYALALSENDEEFALAARVEEGDTYPTEGDVITFPVGEREETENDTLYVVQLDINDIEIKEGQLKK